MIPILSILRAACIPFVLAIASPLLAEAGELSEMDAASLKNGAKFYKRCAACHLPTGAGVPGSFPPLNTHIDSFYKTEGGRKYLTLVMDNGLQGPVTINGIKYRGIMAPQTRRKTPQTVADTLNYILVTFFPESELPHFTAEEISKIRTTEGKLSRKAVRALRPEETPDNSAIAPVD